MESHINALKQKHFKIQQTIKSAGRYPENHTINQLKKQKLLIKDEITKLENNLL